MSIIIFKFFAAIARQCESGANKNYPNLLHMSKLLPRLLQGFYELGTVLSKGTILSKKVLQMLNGIPLNVLPCIIMWVMMLVGVIEPIPLPSFLQGK